MRHRTIQHNAKQKMSLQIIQQNRTEHNTTQHNTKKLTQCNTTSLRKIKHNIIQYNITQDKATLYNIKQLNKT